MRKKPPITEQHWDMILEAIHRRSCVPFLGAAVNASRNGDGASYQGLPLGPEVALRLIERAIGVSVNRAKDLGRVTNVHKKLRVSGLAEDLARMWIENLPRVALHIDVEGVGDRGWLTRRLQSILAEETCEPSPLLKMLAELPLRLVVTTNFDSLLERALDETTAGFVSVTPADIVSPTKLARAIRNPPDALSAYVQNELPPELMGMLLQWNGVEAPSDELIQGLAHVLSRLVTEGNLYMPERFADVRLSSEVERLLRAVPSEPQRLRLNRLLLEEAFPFELQRARKDYCLIVQPMNGFDEKVAQRHAENPPADDVLVVYKFHGSFADAAAGIVITEDDYIGFLSIIDTKRGIPGHIKAMLTDSTVLFLGYSLEDWDFRTLYKTMIEPVEKKKRPTSFAVQWDPPKFWVDYWRQKGVVIYDHDIHAFGDELQQRYVERFGDLRTTAGR